MTDVPNPTNDVDIPDFSSAERLVVRSALQRRFGQSVDLQFADSELRLDPEAPVLTACPTLYWSERGCHFVVFKTAADRYRCQFFYADDEHFGTGRSEYRDLSECVIGLLRAQADHEKDHKGARSGLTGDQIKD